MSATFQPGQRLKIRELAKTMGTSETPVREALIQLVRDRALEMKEGYFIKVRRLSLAEYIELREIRLALEPLAAERAVPLIDAAAIKAFVVNRVGDFGFALGIMTVFWAFMRVYS